jgi:hypothetical protein
MKKRTSKIAPSDNYVMMGKNYNDLIELYNFKLSSVKKTKTEIKKRIINRPIFCFTNGVPHESLCAAMRANNIDDTKKNSPWFKINRNLKKHREYEFNGIKFELPSEESVII